MRNCLVNAGNYNTDVGRQLACCAVLYIHIYNNAGKSNTICKFQFICTASFVSVIIH